MLVPRTRSSAPGRTAPSAPQPLAQARRVSVIFERTGGSDGARRGEEVGDGVGEACGCAPPVPPWADAAAAGSRASRTASSANAGTKAAFVVLAYVPFPQRARAAGPRAPGNTAPDLVEAYGVS